MLLQIDQSIYNLSSSGEYLTMAFEVSEMVKDAVLPLASATIGILIVLELLKVLFAEGQVSWLKMFKLVIFFWAFKDYDTLVHGVLDLIQGILDSFKNANNGAGFVAHGTMIKDGAEYDVTRSTAQEINNEFFLVSLFKMIMRLFQNIVEVLLIATGPFAIMFSFIPGQESVFAGWLRNLISVLLWSVTFMILDFITTAVNLKIVILVHEDFSFYNIGTWLKNYGEAYLMKIVLSLGYLMTPTITTKFFGQSASGSFGKQMLATAGGVYAGAKMAKEKVKEAGSSASGSGGGGVATGGGAGGAAKGAGGAATSAGGAAMAATGVGMVAMAAVKVGKAAAGAVKNGFNNVNKTEN